MKLIVALFVALMLSAGAFGVAACAGSSKTAPPAVTPSASPAAAPQPNPPPAATPPPTATPPAPVAAAPPAAAPPPGDSSAAAPAGGEGTSAGGRGGRGNPPPPPPPAPAVMPPPVAPIVSATAPTPDPRVGLKAGRWDAAQAAWNMRMLSTTPPRGRVLGATHSDLAFSGKYVIQGNYNGFEIYDLSNPAKPVLMQTYLCPASQNDVSVYRNLLFVSGEDLTARIDCGAQGVKDSVSKDRLRGIRIFDISDIANPKNVGNVQTCRGSHTHSLLVDPKDPANVYVYISGSDGVRSPNELPGCVNLSPDKDPNSALFRIEVI